MLTIAWLTWKEALRRRAPLISLLVAALLLVGLFIPLQGRLLLLPRAAAEQTYAAFYVLLTTDIVKFFASIFSIALGAGAISAELERGVLSSILPKPITRFSVYAGKWLGLFCFVSANVVVWVFHIWVVAVYRAPGQSHAGIWHALPALLLYPAVFTTLALLFSTCASYALAGGMAVFFTGIGWAEGVLAFLNKQFAIGTLERLSVVAGYVMPLGRMSREVTQQLGPLYISFSFVDGVLRRQNINDTGMIAAQAFDLPYVLLYILVVFLAGAVVFGRRDI